MFTLARGSINVAAEVQRWQFFLRRMGISQVGNIDADFGMKTETGTKMFQGQHGLSPTGKVTSGTLLKAQTLGYTILPDDYYAQRAGPSFPPAPTNLASPSNQFRNDKFTCFKFLQRAKAQRIDPDEVVIKGNCSDTEPDWTHAHIVELSIPQMRFVVGFSGSMTCHSVAAPIWTALFKKWEQDDLLHLIMTYQGCFNPRYKRDASPSASGHGILKSVDVSALSNHAFGSAFDVNDDQNTFGGVPAFCGKKGSVRELVASANALGVYWGGHFGKQDGMHFEVAKL